MSSEAKAFILRALTKDPKNRASAEELLEHPWIEENGQPEKKASYKE